MGMDSTPNAYQEPLQGSGVFRSYACLCDM